MPPVNALASSGIIRSHQLWGPTGGVTGWDDKFSFHDTYTTAQFQELGLPVGYKVERLNGDVFRLAYHTADIAAGVLCAPDISGNGLVDTDNAVDAATAIGSRTVLFDHASFASISANQFAEGKLVITDGTGIGYDYLIKSNTATTSTDEVTVTLYEPLKIAITTDTDIAIVGNYWNGMVIASTAGDALCKGKVMSVIDFSEAPYGWVQTRGPSGVLTDDTTLTVGCPLQLSDSTNGAVQVLAGGGTDIADIIVEQMVGSCIVVGDSAGQSIVDLQLE